MKKRNWRLSITNAIKSIGPYWENDQRFTWLFKVIEMEIEYAYKRGRDSVKKP